MIVVGYSGGTGARACVEQAIVEGVARDTGILVINAVSGGRSHRIVDAEEIADVEQRLSRSGVQFTISQPIGGDPAEELLLAMDRPEAEMLVIGMRRRTQVGKLFLGSTSQYLLAECAKPVLVVKPGAVGAGDGVVD
nr:universal stress protein [Gordonia zhaorongruii]